MTTYSARIAESTDDAYDSNDSFPGSSNTDTVIYVGATAVGETLYSGFIHDAVNITSGATINSCTITGYRIAFSSDGNEQVTIYCLENGTPTTFGTATNSPFDQFTAGTVTSASVSWTMGADGGDNDPELSPDYAAVVQEVVDTVGNVTDLETLITGTVNAQANFYSFDNPTTGRSALLDLDWTASGGGGGSAPKKRGLALLGVGR